MKRVLACLLAFLLLPLSALAEEGLYVKRLELPKDFILGMDVSSVLALEKSGVTFKNRAGEERDLFSILAENGVNYIRVRVWNHPYDAQGRGFGGGNNDVAAAAEIGRRAAQYGMKLLVNFHYSDFWVDPGKQQAPRAWEGLRIADKAQALYDFTRDSLRTIREAGADIGMVQLGNETNGRLSGEKTWMNIYKLMAAGSRAVRETDPGILVAVHFSNPETAGSYLTYASKLDYYKLDYDVFATSWYPYWHGSLDNLQKVLSDVKAAYGKQVLVAETSYAYTLEDTDTHPNTIGAGAHYEKPWPFTVQGQANAVAAAAEAVNAVGGLGIFYWEGAWVSVGEDAKGNREKWEKDGSGWASSFASEYDPRDAGVYFGGSACDNQALFDRGGRALPSLEVFGLLRTGQEAPLRVDAIADTHLEFDLNGEVTLPNTVHAVMNDGSLQDVPVIWEPIDTAAMKAGGPASYEIRGQAGGREALAMVSMVEYNFLRNPGFEEEDVSMWTARDLGKTEQLYVEEKRSDAKSGKRHYHFYSAGADTVAFTLEQEVSNLPEGTFRFEISIQGGDGGNTEIYSYVKRNGELVATSPARITVYNSWDSPEIRGIKAGPKDTLTVGIHVACQGPGAWGKIDDARLNSQPAD